MRYRSISLQHSDFAKESVGGGGVCNGNACQPVSENAEGARYRILVHAMGIVLCYTLR